MKKTLLWVVIWALLVFLWTVIAEVFSHLLGMTVDRAMLYGLVGVVAGIYADQWASNE